MPHKVIDDYIYGTTGNRWDIVGLPAGDYRVTVFEGRIDDTNGQKGKIYACTPPRPASRGAWAASTSATETCSDSQWAPCETDNYNGGSATGYVTVGSGETLVFEHLEDAHGGPSGLIIRAL